MLISTMQIVSIMYCPNQKSEFSISVIRIVDINSLNWWYQQIDNNLNT